jgi:hypothetical protein
VTSSPSPRASHPISDHIHSPECKGSIYFSFEFGARKENATASECLEVVEQFCPMIAAISGDIEDVIARPYERSDAADILRS